MPQNKDKGGPSGHQQIKLNHRIRAKEVRVIGPEGNQLGVMETRKAIELALQMGLDLAEISPTSNPPVCKILDFGKFKYQLKKKTKQAKKNQSVIITKEIQFRPQINKHDIDFKVKHIQDFLKEGNKVKITIRFKGRESMHLDLAHNLIKQIIDLVGPLGIVESSPKMEGRQMHMMFAPNTKQKKHNPPPVVAKKDIKDTKDTKESN